MVKQGKNEWYTTWFDLFKKAIAKNETIGQTYLKEHSN